MTVTDIKKNKLVWVTGAKIFMEAKRFINIDNVVKSEVI